MANMIKAVTKENDVIVFNNHQEVADHLGVTKQAVAKAMKQENICQGMKLTLIYKNYKHAGDQEKNLVVDDGYGSDNDSTYNIDYCPMCGRKLEVAE